jgi:serine protease Do
METPEQNNATKAIKPVPKSSKKVKAPSAGAIKTTIFVTVAVVAGYGGGLMGSAKQSITETNIGTTEARKQIVSSEGELISEITKEVGSSVVSVSVISQTATQGYFGVQQQESEGAGTGVILSEDGIVITNRHVVPEGAKSVSVTLSDGTTLDDVEVIGRTNDSDPLDIAFLKINDTEGKKLTVATIGDSSSMEVGDRVIAIGNALGQFENTVTSGLISGYGRDIEASDGGSSVESLQNLFQTDAAINPGNSGGPLMNLSGEVNGINVAVANAKNIGYAKTINEIKGLIASDKKNGKLERPYLGVRYVSLNDETAYYYNLDTKEGAYIAPSQSGESSIVSGSPADKAGLEEKDVILEIGGVKVNEKNSLVSILGRHTVGESVELKVERGNEEIKLNVKLEAIPEN